MAGYPGTPTYNLHIKRRLLLPNHLKLDINLLRAGLHLHVEHKMFKPLSTQRFGSPASDFSPGPAPFLEWIETGRLVVDVTYQREIGRRGAVNVNQIAENFDWSKFAPVIVAPVEGGQFAIVDGQHRTTAAMLRGQDKVPCQVVQADRAKQAAAYAAVNGNITKTTAQQLYHARLAAKDPHALELAEVCSAAEVEILRKNLVRSEIKKGQTYAVTALSRCLSQYGRDTLITALHCSALLRRLAAIPVSCDLPL